MDKKILIIIALVVLIAVVFILNTLTKKRTTVPNSSPTTQTNTETSQDITWEAKKVGYDGSLGFLKIVDDKTLRALDSTNSKIVEIDLKTSSSKKILDNLPKNISLLYWSKDGELATVFTAEGISVVDLKNKKIDPLPSKASFAFPSTEGRYFLYGFNEDTGAKVYFGDAEERKRVYAGSADKKITEVIYVDFSNKTFYFLSNFTKDGVSTDLYKWQDGKTSLVLENCAFARYLDNVDKLIAISGIDNTVLIGSLSELQSVSISSTDIALITYFDSMIYYLNKQGELVSEQGKVVFNNFPGSVIGLESTDEGIIAVTESSLLYLTPPSVQQEISTPAPSVTPTSSPAAPKKNSNESTAI